MIYISDSGRGVLRNEDKDILKPKQDQSHKEKKLKKRGMER